jgi:hypothetical protein
MIINQSQKEEEQRQKEIKRLEEQRDDIKSTFSTFKAVAYGLKVEPKLYF